MLYVVTIYVLGILANARAESSYDECPGNSQVVLVPDDYDKWLPDIDNVTEVELDFQITQLKMVKEDR